MQTNKYYIITYYVSNLVPREVVSYNHYIVSCNDGVWKSSLYNLEHQQQLDLQHTFKVEGYYSSICIHNGTLNVVFNEEEKYIN